MKTLRNSIFAILAVFAASCSTDDVEDRPVVVGTDAPVLSAPEEGTVYVLTEANADVQAERFVWTAANFGAGIIPNYDLEIDFAGQDFDTPVIVASSNGTTQVSVSQNVLNIAALALEAEPEEPGTFQVRIKAYVNSEVMYSNAVEISITPYSGVQPLQDLFLVGDALESGWNNNNNNIPMFRDGANQNLYHFTGYFNAGAFKLLTAKGSWHPQYGMTAEGVLGVSTPDGGNEAQNIPIAVAGYYTVEVNTEEMTYSVTAFDASGATTYTSIGMVGDATPGGWDVDTQMTTQANNSHLWHVGNAALVAGGAKFRVDGAWTVNWGSGAFPSGLGLPGGDNIPVTADQAGNYDVWFNDLDSRYIFIRN